jgi:hypothetical protein
VAYCPYRISLNAVNVFNVVCFLDSATVKWLYALWADMAVGASDVTAGLKRGQTNELRARLLGRTYHVFLQDRRVSAARNPQKQAASSARHVWKVKVEVTLRLTVYLSVLMSSPVCGS